MVAQLYFALHGVIIGMTELFTIITNDFILSFFIDKATLRIQSFTLNRLCGYYIKFEKLVV